MDRRRLSTLVLGVVVAVVLVVSVAVGLLLFDVGGPAPGTLDYGYEYEVAVGTDGELRNVTLVLPLPVRDGESAVGRALATGAPSVVDAPDGWAYAVVETASGPMLRVRAARVTPPGRRIEVALPGSDPVATRRPAGREPTLAPRSNAVERPCPSTDAETTGATCRTFETRTRVEYAAGEGTRATVRVRYEGSNVWVANGWTGNRFEQRLVVERRGPASGWTTVNATERAGVGTYPGGRLAPV